MIVLLDPIRRGMISALRSLLDNTAQAQVYKAMLTTILANMWENGLAVDAHGPDYHARLKDCNITTTNGKSRC